MELDSAHEGITSFTEKIEGTKRELYLFIDHVVLDFPLYCNAVLN